MKTLFFATVAIAQLAALDLTLPFQLQPVVAGDNEGTVDIDVADIARLQVRLLTDGETGIGRLLSTTGANRYELDGTNIVLHVANADPSVLQYKLTVSGVYGQVKLNATIVLDVKKDGEASVVLNPYVFDAIAAGGGGGADYKTDIYMDGAGRVILERLSDGSTLLLDEHENPIMRRNADGSTEYYDAYQSARLLIDANGVVSVNYTEDETIKTLQLAEAIMARTRKRLLTNTAGEETIKDEEGNILTHAQIYEMLMTSADFVVLVRSDHAFHPNLVTETQIAFTCSYLGTDGQISAERVNITSENVVTYSQGKGIALTANNSIAFGDRATAKGQYSVSHGQLTNSNAHYSSAEGKQTKADGVSSHAEGSSADANGESSHAEGNATTAQGNASHAEGVRSQSHGVQSHAEGTHCFSYGGTSHAEGNYCETGTSGGSAHAEGSYTNANGAASHTEGYRTITTEGGSHAQGCWNKVEGGQYAFMHGCGTDEGNRANAFLIAGDQVHMLGIGGYDGTNYGTEGVKSVQAVIRELQLKLVNF